MLFARVIQYTTIKYIFVVLYLLIRRLIILLRRMNSFIPFLDLTSI